MTTCKPLAEALDDRVMPSATATAAAWVGGLYREYLGRAPEPAGLAYWQAVLPVVGRAGVVDGIRHSLEARTMWVACELREYGVTAAPDRIRQWADDLLAKDESRVLADIATSPEWVWWLVASYAQEGVVLHWDNIPGYELISFDYSFIVGWDAWIDQPRLHYWAARMDAGVPLPEIAWNYIESPQRRGAEVAEAYRNLLGRDAAAWEAAWWVASPWSVAQQRALIAASDEAFTRGF